MFIVEKKRAYRVNGDARALLDDSLQRTQPVDLSLGAGLEPLTRARLTFEWG